MIDINAIQIMQESQSQKLGLPTYAKIMKGNPQNADFKKLFNSYYGINSARRNNKWKDKYYKLFDALYKTSKRKNKKYTFAFILKALYRLTKNVEPSFSSKMLATLDDSKPIWDKHVLKNLGLKKLKGKDDKSKLNDAIYKYSLIEREYQTYLRTPHGQCSIDTFDISIPQQYRSINNIKKLDFLLWSKR